MKDLCARLPYGVMCVFSEPPYGETTEPLKIGGLRAFIEDKWKVKPYLRPMSSMTEEEFVHFMALRGRNLSSYDIRLCMKEAFNMPNFITIVSPLYNYLRNIEWLLSKHFDAHGLIEKNLALDCTGLHIYD